METAYPPIGFFAFIDTDEGLIRWTYVQSLPAVECVSDLLVKRDPDLKAIANKMAETMLQTGCEIPDDSYVLAAQQSYGMALMKLGVAPFTTFLVSGGQVTTSFVIPADSAVEAHEEFDRLRHTLEAEEAGGTSIGFVRVEARV